MNGIRPDNMPAFEQLVERIKAASLGCTFSSIDWQEIVSNMRRSVPRWYRQLLESYPLGSVEFIVPPAAPDPSPAPLPWTCSILCPGALKN